MASSKKLAGFAVLATLYSVLNIAYGLDDTWQMEFEKFEHDNPVLGPLSSTPWTCPVRQEEVLWEEKDVFNPGAVVRDGKVHLLYRAEDTVGHLAGTSRIGLASSKDGIHFTDRRPTPVVFPDHEAHSHFEWDGGCEDPRVIESPDGTYVMTYTTYDGTARLSVATSKDLINWEKHGPAFGNAFGKAYINAWTKSGSIVVEPQPDGRLLAVQINGTYWMYWGENHIYVATSDNLIDWTPILSDDEKGFYRGRPDHQDLPVYAMKPKSVLRPRKGKFDSNLVEPGPPAILRDDGILFIYNSKNTACPDEEGMVCPKGVADPKLAPGTYSAGQALFSRDDPTKLLARSSDTFFKPTANFEITGQVGNVCFLEGLVYFKRKWFLYYGTADSKIAVAVATKYDYRGHPLPAGTILQEEEESEENEEEVYGKKKSSPSVVEQTVASTRFVPPEPDAATLAALIGDDELESHTNIEFVPADEGVSASREENQLENQQENRQEKEDHQHQHQQHQIHEKDGDVEKVAEHVETKEEVLDDAAQEMMEQEQEERDVEEIKASVEALQMEFDSV
eukprot:gene8881-18383_t